MRFSLVAASGGYSLVSVPELLIEGLLLVRSTSPRVPALVGVPHGFSSRSPQALQHRLNSCGAWA